MRHFIESRKTTKAPVWKHWPVFEKRSVILLFRDVQNDSSDDQVLTANERGMLNLNLWKSTDGHQIMVYIPENVEEKLSEILVIWEDLQNHMTFLPDVLL